MVLTYISDHPILRNVQIEFKVHSSGEYYPTWESRDNVPEEAI